MKPRASSIAHGNRRRNHDSSVAVRDLIVGAGRLVPDPCNRTRRGRIAGGKRIFRRFVDQIVRMLVLPRALVVQSKQFDRAVGVFRCAHRVRDPS